MMRGVRRQAFLTARGGGRAGRDASLLPLQPCRRTHWLGLSP